VPDSGQEVRAMRAFTNRKPQYRGDTTIGVWIEYDDGQKRPVFNIRRNHYGYTNDRYGVMFRTIKEYKTFALANEQLEEMRNDL
jgi:hypothetical protein